MTRSSVLQPPRERIGPPRTTVLLSGGLDSATLLGFLLGQGWPVVTRFVDYGQPASEREAEASRAVAEHYAVSWLETVVRGTDPVGIGEILGRNDLLIAVASFATPLTSIAIATHSGTRYADCSQAHSDTWQALLDIEFSGERRLLTPFRRLYKRDIASLAADLQVPLELTYSCEAAHGPCGECTSCRDRRLLLAGT